MGGGVLTKNEAFFLPLGPLVAANMGRTLFLVLLFSLGAQFFVEQGVVWPELLMLLSGALFFYVHIRRKRESIRRCAAQQALASMRLAGGMLVLLIGFGCLYAFLLSLMSLPIFVLVAQDSAAVSIFVCGLVYLGFLAFLYSSNPVLRSDKRAPHKIVMTLLLALGLLILPLLIEQIAGSEKFGKMMNARPAPERI